MELFARINPRGKVSTQMFKSQFNEVRSNRPTVGLFCNNLKDAGGKSVALGLISALLRRDIQSAYNLVIVAPPDSDYTRLRSSGASMLVMDSGPGMDIKWFTHTANRLASVNRFDAAFYLGNVAPLNSRLPYGLLVHNPWFAYPKGVHWSRLSWRESLHRRIRNLIIHRSCRQASIVAVQTVAMRHQVADLLGRHPTSLPLLPNSNTPVEHGAADDSVAQRLVQELQRPYAICVSKYYPHKNLEILPAVADILRKVATKDTPVIVTTFDFEQESRTRALKSHFSKNPFLRNLGTVPRNAVPGLYSAAACMILPTLLESFTGTYLDAAARGCPIVTSDAPFARELCPVGTVYIDPLNAQQIAQALLSPIPRAVPNARPRLGWDDVAEIFDGMLRTVAGLSPLPDRAPEPK